MEHIAGSDRVDDLDWERREMMRAAGLPPDNACVAHRHGQPGVGVLGDTRQAHLRFVGTGGGSQRRVREGNVAGGSEKHVAVCIHGAIEIEHAGDSGL
jgi:hypothetical protein